MTSQKLHFASNGDRDEFADSEYGNFDPGLLTLIVSPGLFGRECAQLDGIREFLSHLPPAADPPLQGPIEVADAFAGAIVMGMQSAATREDAGSVCEGPGTLVLADERTLADSLVDYLQALIGSTPADHAFLKIVVRALLDEPRLSRDAPLQFLNLVKEHLEALEEIDPAIGQSLTAIAEILMGDRDIPRFAENGLETARALLLYLLKPDPSAVLTWFGQIEGVSGRGLALAASFAGISRGYRGLPVGMRGTAALQKLMALAQADAVNALRDSAPGRFLPEPPSIKATAKSDGHGYIEMVYKRGNTKLLETRRPDLSIRGKLLRSDHGDSSNLSEAVAVARGLGWDDCIATTFTFPTGAIHAEGGMTHLRILGAYGLEEQVDLDEYRRRLVDVDEGRLREVVAAIEREHPHAQPAASPTADDPRPGVVP